MATRFINTHECKVHDKIYQEMINRQENDTVLYGNTIGLQGRALVNDSIRKVMEIEARGGGLDEILPLISGQYGDDIWLEGKVDTGLIPVGQSAAIIRKGTDARFDSYSGFADDGGHATELHDLLQQKKISCVIVYGLATDYCVKATALDALAREYAVLVLVDLSRGVSADTTESAVQELKQQGAIIENFADQHGNQPAMRRRVT